MAPAVTPKLMAAHRFNPTILREYDVRGIVGETLSADDARALGCAFGTRLVESGGRTVAVGYDGLGHVDAAHYSLLYRSVQNASECYGFMKLKWNLPVGHQVNDLVTVEHPF